MAEKSEVRATVGSISEAASDQLELNSMKMATVGETRVALIRTSDGVFALDNACPHQGYGLVTGALGLDGDGDAVVTCQWHNWKFRVSDGVCTVGEEDVACHQVEVSDTGDITVTVSEPSVDEKLDRLWPSLRRGLENNYMGQVSRDTIRLMDAGAAPAQIMAEALAIGAPKAEYGVGHEMALAADCLHLAELWEGDDRALPLIQGLAGIGETTRDRAPQVVPEPDGSVSVSDAIESEDVQGAMAGVMAMIHDGKEVSEVKRHFLGAVAAHHLSYGHGAIYTQKAFELLDRIGWDQAPALLPHLATSLAYATREDTLPYMRKPMRVIEAMDFGVLSESADRSETGWDSTDLVTALLDDDAPPLQAAADAIRQGAGVEGLLDAVSIAVSKRLLRYDLSTEADPHNNFGWLDITHGLTYARAARWAWHQDPGPDTARLAMFTGWLAWDTGRLERRHGVTTPEEEIDLVGRAASDDLFQVGEQISKNAMDDRGGSFIVVAHLVKTTQAALEEVEFTGSRLPLMAAARFVEAPRQERFIARAVNESLSFIRTGKPPLR